MTPMRMSPYPRRALHVAQQRRRKFLRAWSLYVAGAGFIALGLTWFAMKPSVNYYNLQDFLMGLVWAGFGIVVRRAAHLDLMRLKGLAEGDKRSIGASVLWLPWYLRQRDAASQDEGFHDPPLP